MSWYVSSAADGCRSWYGRAGTPSNQEILSFGHSSHKPRCIDASRTHQLLDEAERQSQYVSRSARPRTGDGESRMCGEGCMEIPPETHCSSITSSHIGSGFVVSAPREHGLASGATT